MSTFHLIRHGEKDSPPNVLVGRSPGIHLTATGRQQAESLVPLLAAAPIAHVYSSPIERARETAGPLARSKGLSVQIDEAFSEYEMGAWTGRTFESLEKDPHWKNFNSLRSVSPPPDGETMLHVQHRFVERMFQLYRAHPHDHLAIVSHGDPIRAALLYFLGAPVDCYDRFEIGLASVSILTLEPHGAQVQALNLRTAPPSIQA